jgi:hypothetical protein
MNAGIPGWNSTQELLLLQTRLVDLNPDVVVVLDGYNDIWGPLYYDPRVGYPFNFMVVEEAWRRYTSTQPWPLRLLEQSRLIRRVRELLSGTTSVDGFVLGTSLDPASIDRLVNEAAAAHRANWRKMERICLAERIDCVLALQPVHLDQAALGGTQAVFRMFFDRIVDDLHRDALADGAIRIDLRGFFADDPTSAFFDSVHLYDEANRRLAQSLVQILCESGERLRTRCR